MVIEEGIPIVLVSRGHDPHPSLKVVVSMLAVGISFGLMTAMTTVSLCLLHLNDEKTLWYCALLWALTNAILGKVMMWGLVNLAARSREPSRSRSFPLTSMEASFLSGHIMAASTIYISVACYLDGPSIFVVLFTIVIVAVIFGLAVSSMWMKWKTSRAGQINNLHKTKTWTRSGAGQKTKYFSKTGTK
jgi:hypothetical protein